jgi:hypothetical protein
MNPDTHFVEEHVVFIEDIVVGLSVLSIGALMISARARRYVALVGQTITVLGLLLAGGFFYVFRFRPDLLPNQAQPANVLANHGPAALNGTDPVTVVCGLVLGLAGIAFFFTTRLRLQERIARLDELEGKNHAEIEQRLTALENRARTGAQSPTVILREAQALRSRNSSDNTGGGGGGGGGEGKRVGDYA